MRLQRTLRPVPSQGIAICECSSIFVLTLPTVFANDSHRALVHLLQQEVTRHNRQVMGYAALSVVASVVFWAAAYAVSYWLTLLARTAVQGTEATMPAHFEAVFWSAAAFLLLLAWLHRLATPNDLPRDDKTVGEILLDFLLAIPRTTLAIWANLSAWLRLSPADLHLAADLVAAVTREQKLPVHSVPLAIPDDATRDRVVFALLLLHVLEIRREDDVALLRLSVLGPSKFRIAAGVPPSSL